MAFVGLRARVPVRTSVQQLLFLNSLAREDIIVLAILQRSLDFDRHSNYVRINPLCGLIDRGRPRQTPVRKAKAFLWSLLYGRHHECHSLCIGLRYTPRPARMRRQRSVYEACLRTVPKAFGSGGNQGDFFFPALCAALPPEHVVTGVFLCTTRV
jgi:hypothetical protein